MSEAVDTRIVEAKFDSAQFEKGVDRTVKKLDELKKSLNLEDAGKSVAQLADKTKEASEKASSSLEKLTDSFTNFTGMLRQKLLSGIADEVVGVFFKMENAVKSFVNSLAFGQIGTGMDRYASLLSSVRTLVFSGVDQDAAYETMNRLTDFADQTSYSLDALVSTMSKFKTAGASLETAERMVIGLSNAAASMGVNAQDATRAYLNMQQAYSKGFMQQNDWISFESLPMVGEKFNQAILDAAESVGTLKKEANGTYKTLNKTFKEVRTSGADAKGITAENLGTKLSSKWFNKAVMEKVFGETYFFSLADDKVISDLKKTEDDLKKQVKEGSKTQDEADAEFNKKLDDIAKERADLKREELDKKYGINKAELDKQLEDGIIKQKEYNELMKDYNKEWEEFNKSNHFTKFGWEAFRAGQEARSFADVMNMLKDVISRGWAKSFEIIFGELDKASKFFTDLADSSLVNAIRRISEFRNAVLEVWAGDVEGSGGRTALIQTFEILDSLIGRILGRFGLFTDDEDEFESITMGLGNRLSAMSRDIRDFTLELDKWFTDERIDRIVDTVNTISGVIGTIFKVLGVGLRFVINAFNTLDPVFGAIIDNINKIINRVNDLVAGEGVNSLENGLNNILIILNPLTAENGPIVKFINILGEIGAFFAEMAAGTFTANIQFFSDTLGFLIELFGGVSAQKAEDGAGVIGGIKNSIIELGDACKDMFQFVADFFHNLYEDILTLLGIHELKEGEEGGLFSNLKKFIDGNEFIASVKQWIKDIPKNMKKLWTTVSDWVFGKKVTIVKPSGAKNELRLKSEFSKMMDDIFKEVKKFITTDVPKKAKEIWDSFVEAIFGKKSSYGQMSNQYGANIQGGSQDIIKEGFVGWFEGAVQRVKDWIADIPERISELWNDVVDFLFYENKAVVIRDPRDGSIIRTVDEKVKNKFRVWLDELPKNILKWFKNLPTIISDLWNKFIDFIFYRTENVTIKDPDSGEVVETVEKKVETGFKQFWDSIPGLIKDIPTRVQKLWNDFIDLIFYRNESVVIRDPRNGDIIRVVDQKVETGFKQWLDNTVENIKNVFENRHEIISNLWNDILDFIFGKESFDSNKYEKIHRNNGLEAAEAYMESTSGNSIIDRATKFVENLGINIGEIISNLPANIVKGWNFSVNIFGDLVNAIAGWFEKQNDSRDIINEDSQKIADEITKDSEKSPLIKAIIELGQSIAKLFTETLPKFVTEGLDYIKGEDFGGQIYDAIKSIFGLSDTWWDELKKDAEGFANRIADEIRNLPEYIRTAVKEAKNFLGIGQESFSQQIYDEVLRVRGPEEARKYAKKFENQFNLWDIIKEMLGAGKDAIVDLGPDILNIFDKVAEALKKGLEWVTNFFNNRDKNEDIGVSLTKAIGAEEEIGEGSEFGKAIAKFGQTLGDVITKTIPDFIKAAIDEVCVQVPKILEKLTSMFTGEDPTGLINLETSEEGSTELTRSIVDETEKVADAADEEAKIMAELQKRRDNVNKLFNDADAKYRAMLQANQESATGAVFKESEVTAAKAEVLKYEELAAALNHFEGKTMAELDEVSKDAIVEVKDQSNFMSSLLNVVGTIGSSKSTAVAVSIVAITHLIESLTETVQVTDELEATAKLAKWHTIEIAIAGIIGILAWTFTLASMDDPTKYNRVKEVLDGFVDLIKEIGGVVKWVSGFYFGSKAVGDIAEAFGDYTDLKKLKTEDAKEAIEELASETDPDNKDSFIGTLGALIAKGGGVTLSSMALSSISNILGEGLAGFFDGLAESISLVGVAVDTFMTLLDPVIDKLTELHEKLPTAIESVGQIKKMLETFWAILNDLQINPASQAEAEDHAKAETGYAFTSAKFDSYTVHFTEGIDDTIAFIGIYLDIANRFATALKSFSEIEDPWHEISEFNAMFAAKENGFSTLMETLKTSLSELISATCEGDNPFGNVSPEKAASYFNLLGAFIEMFGKSIGSFNTDSTEAVRMAFDSISSFVDFLKTSGFDKETGPLTSLFVKDVDLGRFGRLLAIFGVNVKEFFVSMDTIRQIVGTGKDENDYTDSFETVIEMSRVAMAGIAGVMRVLNSSQSAWEFLTSLLGDNENKFAKFIGAYADGIVKYFTAFHQLRSTEGIELSEEDLDYFKETSDIFQTMMESFDIIYNKLAQSILNGDSMTYGFSQLRTRISLLFNSIIGNAQLHSKDSKLDSAGNEYLGFFEYYKQFLIKMRNAAVDIAVAEGGNYDLAFSRVKLVLESIKETLDMFSEISSSSGELKELTEDLGEYISLMDIFVQNESIFTRFFGMAEKFNSVGLSNAASFAEMFSNIASALKIFSEYTMDTEGNGPHQVSRVYDYSQGLKNLLKMDMEDLTTVIMKMTEVFNDPIILANMETFGNNIVVGLANGIKNATSDAVEAMKGLAAAISGTFTVQMEIGSPSRLFERFGKYLDMGLENGIEKNARFPMDSVVDLSDEMADKVEAILASPFSTADDKVWAYDYLYDHLVPNPMQMKNLTNEAANSIGEAITTISSVSQKEFNRVKESKQKSVFDTIWDHYFGTPTYSDNDPLVKAGKVVTKVVDTWELLSQEIAPNMVDTLFGNGFINEIVGLYNHTAEKTAELKEALMTDLAGMATNNNPIAVSISNLLGSVFESLDQSGGGWDVLGQVLESAAQEFTDNEAIQYVGEVFGKIRAAAEGKEGATLGTSILGALLGSATDYLAKDNPLVGVAMDKLGDLIGLSTEEDLMLEPKVKPVLEITDDFKAGMDQINSTFGGLFNLGNWFPGNSNGFEMPYANNLNIGDQIPKVEPPKDYSNDMKVLGEKLDTVQHEIALQKQAMASMRFNITGKDMVYTIGPDMNDYLGYEDATRGSRYESWQQEYTV